MKSLVESLNNYLSRFIVETSNPVPKLIGGSDSKEYKGKIKGLEVAYEWFKNYLDRNLLQNKILNKIKDIPSNFNIDEFINEFNEFLNNLFANEKQIAPLVINYNRTVHNWALRRWTEGSTKEFINKYKWLLEENKGDYKKFSNYHNTTLGSETPTATEYEIIIATGLNIACHNEDVSEESYEKWLRASLNPDDKKSNIVDTVIERFMSFYSQEEDFLKNIVKVAGQDPILKDSNLIFRKINVGKLSKLWENTNANKTSKTDIAGYSDEDKDNPIIKFSIKKSSGAQAMSGAKWESLCTLQSCWNTLQTSGVLTNPDNSKEKIEDLINLFNSKEWLGNDKKRNDDLKYKLYEVLKNIDDKDVRLFVYSILVEAITGGDKFKDNDEGVPNAVLSWDNSIYIHNIDEYVNGLYNYIYSGSNDDIAKKIGEIFTINHKNSTTNIDNRHAAFRVNLPNISKILINKDSGKFPDKQFEMLFNKKLKRDLNAS